MVYFSLLLAMIRVNIKNYIMNSRGILIVFEGCDKSGKTTQCLKLVKDLADIGHKVELFQFPNRSTIIGNVINNHITQTYELNDQTIHLLFSANRWEMRQKMIDKINEGVIIIVNRYAYSGVAYAAAKGLDITWCKALSSIWTLILMTYR